MDQLIIEFAQCILIKCIICPLTLLPQIMLHLPASSLIYAQQRFIWVSIVIGDPTLYANVMVI